ncbi:MAG TPA: YIP1 family protein [Myxococcota bacterium]|nr:YIP1 family protein [Myxococcota bacterium]HRY96863.1 YIP1 family protein [Myxococcota bacterium]
MQQLSTLALVLVAPSRGFKRLAQAELPRCLLMVFCLVGCLWAAHASVHARIDTAAMERQVAAQPAGPPGEGGGGGAELGEEKIAENARLQLNLRRIVGYAALALGALVGLLLVTFLFWLFAGAWRPGQGYWRSLRLVAHLGLPLAVRQLAALPVVWSYPSVDPAATRELFRSDLGAALGLPVHGLLDPFWIWTGLLAGLACRALGRGRVRSALVGLAFWLLSALALGRLGP